MAETEDYWTQAISERSRVRLRYADGGIHAEGNIISYSIVPSVCIETDDGMRIHWRHDMAEVIELTDPAERALEQHWPIGSYEGPRGQTLWYGCFCGFPADGYPSEPQLRKHLAAAVTEALGSKT